MSVVYECSFTYGRGEPSRVFSLVTSNQPIRVVAEYYLNAYNRVQNLAECPEDTLDRHSLFEGVEASGARHVFFEGWDGHYTIRRVGVVDLDCGSSPEATDYLSLWLACLGLDA